MLHEENPHQPAYFESTPEGDIRPLDPVTEEPMVPGAIPESLLADEELKAGFDFLRDNAEHIRFGLLLTGHGAADGLRRAGIDLHGEAEVLADQGGTLFLEGADDTGGSRDSLVSFISLVSNRPAEQTAEVRADIQASGKLTPFLSETIDCVAGTGVPVARPDYLADSSRTADRVLASWAKELERLKLENNDPARKVQEWFSTNLGFTIYRDWYLVGKIGSHFARQAKNGASEEYVGKLLAGENHKNIGRHFEAMDIHTEYTGETAGPEGELSKRIAQTAGNALIRADQQLG